MLQLEIEFGPLAIGFSLGAVIFLYNRLIPARVRKQDGRPHKAEPATPSGEPQAEPVPEPSPCTEAAVAAARPSQRLTATATASAPALVLLAVALAAVGSRWAASSVELPAPATPAPAVMPAAPVQRPTQAAPPPAPPAAPLTELAAPVAPADEAVAESVARLVTAPPAEPFADLASALWPDPLVELLVEPPAERREAQPIDPNVVTLNLTRQLMAVHAVDDIVYYKSAYWATISVGTPPVKFKVVFDTGSGHLILPSTFCHSQTCRAHRRYRRSQSSTATDIDFDGSLVSPGQPRDQLTVSFGTGEVTGVFVEDIVCEQNEVGELPEMLHTRCMPMRMVAATAMSVEPFETFEFDGVMGMGLPGLSQAPEFNYLRVMSQTLRQAGSRTPNIFAVHLAEDDEKVSQITLGGYDATRLDSDIYWNPVLQPELGHWQLRIKSIRVDGNNVTFCQNDCRAVVDTGTSLLAVPVASFSEMYELLRHEADPLLECKGPGPKLHFDLESFTVTLEPRDYARLETSIPQSWTTQPKGPKLPFDFAQNASSLPAPEMCKPMLMSMDLDDTVGAKLFVLGEPVLRRYYTIYDSEEAAPRIGFAHVWHGPEQEEPEPAAPAEPLEGDDLP